MSMSRPQFLLLRRREHFQLLCRPKSYLGPCPSDCCNKGVRTTVEIPSGESNVQYHLQHYVPLLVLLFYYLLYNIFNHSYYPLFSSYSLVFNSRLAFVQSCVVHSFYLINNQEYHLQIGGIQCLYVTSSATTKYEEKGANKKQVFQYKGKKWCT